MPLTAAKLGDGSIRGGALGRMDQAEAVSFAATRTSRCDKERMPSISAHRLTEIQSGSLFEQPEFSAEQIKHALVCMVATLETLEGTSVAKMFPESATPILCQAALQVVLGDAAKKENQAMSGLLADMRKSLTQSIKFAEVAAQPLMVFGLQSQAEATALKSAFDETLANTGVHAEYIPLQVGDKVSLTIRMWGKVVFPELSAKLMERFAAIGGVRTPLLEV